MTEFAFGHTIAGEYEEALLWADRSLREMPRFRVAINLNVILYVLLGRVDEARQWLGRLQEIVYGLTIAGFKAFLAPILPPEVLALYLEALCKAGLPEAQAGVRPAHRPFGVAGLPAAKPGLEWG